MESLIYRSRQFVCELFGRHAITLNFEPDRMFLGCTVCGIESPGLSVIPRPPAPSTDRVRRFQQRLRLDRRTA